MADMARELLHERATSPVEIRCEAYETSLPKALADLGHPDCIVLDGTTGALFVLLRCYSCRTIRRWIQRLPQAPRKKLDMNTRRAVTSFDRKEQKIS